MNKDCVVHRGTFARGNEGDGEIPILFGASKAGYRILLVGHCQSWEVRQFIFVDESHCRHKTLFPPDIVKPISS